MIRSSSAHYGAPRTGDPETYHQLAARLNTPPGAVAAVEHIWADVLRNPIPAATEPFHGDLIPDIDYLSGVECDMRAEREAAV